MISVGRAMQATGLVCAAEGNVSARLDAGRMLCTPAGLRKGELSEADLVVTDYEGRKVSGDRPVSTEIRLHLEVYRRRPDVAAVVHAHPETATAFTIAGVDLDLPISPEAVVVLDRIGLAPYGMPGTPDLPATLAGVVERTDVILLERHGAVCGGVDLWDALNRMETLEKTARLAAAALRLGRLRTLPDHEVARLRRYREEVYQPRLRATAE
jgi:L-fuculose-phosphate aldolase